MSWWAAIALAVMAIPVLLLAGCGIGDWRHDRRIRQTPSRSVAGIQARVKEEQTD